MRDRTLVVNGVPPSSDAKYGLRSYYQSQLTMSKKSKVPAPSLRGRDV